MEKELSGQSRVISYHFHIARTCFNLQVFAQLCTLVVSTTIGPMSP